MGRSLCFDQLWFSISVAITASTYDHWFIISPAPWATVLEGTSHRGRKGIAAVKAWSVAAGSCGKTHLYLNGSRGRANLLPYILSLKSWNLPEYDKRQWSNAGAHMVFQFQTITPSLAERQSVMLSFPTHFFSPAIWVSQFTVTMEDVYMKTFQSHACVLEVDLRLICLSSDPKSTAQSFDWIA